MISVCETPFDQSLPFEDMNHFELEINIPVGFTDKLKMVSRLLLSVLLISGIGIEGKKKKSSKKTNLFDSETLNCLVCR